MRATTLATVTYWAAKGPRHQGLAVPLNTCDPKEVTMVWVLLLSMATPNGGGVAIEKFAYYSTEDECIKARTIFGKDGKSQTPRIPLALCVPVESPQHIITK
jgi:hypothetical protein